MLHLRFTSCLAFVAAALFVTSRAAAGPIVIHQSTGSYGAPVLNDNGQAAFWRAIVEWVEFSREGLNNAHQIAFAVKFVNGHAWVYVDRAYFYVPPAGSGP